MHGDVVTLTFRRRGQICTRTSPHQEKQKLRAPTLIFNKMAVRTMRRAFGSVSRQQTLHFGRNLVRMVIHLLWVATSFILLPLDNAILLAVYIIGLVSHLLSSSCPSRQRKAALRNEHFYPKTVLVTGIDTPPPDWRSHDPGTTKGTGSWARASRIPPSHLARACPGRSQLATKSRSRNIFHNCWTSYTERKWTFGSRVRTRLPSWKMRRPRK